MNDIQIRARGSSTPHQSFCSLVLLIILLYLFLVVGELLPRCSHYSTIVLTSSRHAVLLICSIMPGWVDADVERLNTTVRAQPRCPDFFPSSLWLVGIDADLLCIMVFLTDGIGLSSIPRPSVDTLFDTCCHRWQGFNTTQVRKI